MSEDLNSKLVPILVREVERLKQKLRGVTDPGAVQFQQQRASEPQQADRSPLNDAASEPKQADRSSLNDASLVSLWSNNNGRNMSKYGHLKLGADWVEVHLDAKRLKCGETSYDVTGAAVTMFSRPDEGQRTFQVHVKSSSPTELSQALYFTAHCHVERDHWVNAIQFNVHGGVLVVKKDVGKRILLVDVAVDGKKALLNASNEDVTVIYFDSKTDTTASMVAKLASAGSDFASVALANHGPTKEGIWKISANESVNVTDAVDKSSDFGVLMATMATMVTVAGHVDLMACNLASVCPDFIGRLESCFCVDFTASMNATGNDKDGGDWEMETDGIDLVKLYFEAPKIQQYGETMDGEFWGLLKGAAVGAVFVAAVCATGGGAAAMTAASGVLNTTAAVMTAASGTAAAGTAAAAAAPIVVTTNAGAIATGAMVFGVAGAITADSDGHVAQAVEDTLHDAIDNESQRYDEEKKERDEAFGVNVATTGAGLVHDRFKKATPIRRFFDNSEAVLCAKFAKEVYSSPDSRRNMIDGYGLVKSLYDESNYDHDRMVAYYSKSRKRLIISFRGTHNAADFLSDAELLFTGDLSDISSSVKFFERALVECPNCQRVRVTGHSLGGAIAMLTLRQVEGSHGAKLEQSHVFNPGTNSLNSIGAARFNVQVHRCLNDAVSAGNTFSQHTDKIVNYRGRDTSVRGAHLMSNFLR